MSAEIIPFPTNKTVVVQFLEHQLSLAKEGKIKFVGIAVVTDRNVGYSGWSPDDHIEQELLTAALGAVGFLNARFYESALAGAGSTEDPPDAA